MTHEPNDQFDTMLSDGLRHRAAAAGRPSRGFSDVRRRYRRRRQQQVAVGLLPAVAGLGWLVTRPRTDAPLQPSGDGLIDCGDTTLPTWSGTTYPPTTVSMANTTSTTVTLDPEGSVVVPYTGPTAPPWTGGTTTTSLVDSAGNPVVVSTTWLGEVSTTTTTLVPPVDPAVTTTTVCVPTLPTTETGPTTSTGDSTTTTSIVFGDFTSTKVQVANCSAQNGVARMLSTALTDAGFTTVEATNGTCDPKIDNSYVIYDESVPGAQAVAETLARMLGGITVEAGVLPIKTESGAWAEGSGVVVLLGNDLAGKTLDQLTAPTTTFAQP